MTSPTFVHRYVPPHPVCGRTLLLLHGVGGDEHQLISLGAELDPKAGLLSLRGNVVDGPFPRFFRRLAGGGADEADLRSRVLDLVAFVAWAAVEYRFNPALVVAVGYSDGANILATALMRSPSTFSAAVLLHATVPVVPAELPNLDGKRVFLSAGESDPLVPPEDAIAIHRLLSQCEADAHLAWFPGGHDLSTPEVAASTEWMAERL